MHLKLQSVGPLQHADLELGDLTVFVGPQASGKSIALQFLKLFADAGHVQDQLRRYGLDWSGDLPQFLDVYFGEGMRSIWDPAESVVQWNRKPAPLEGLVARRRKAKDESLFFIPAQRVLALREGWPRPFTDYSPGDPYVVRDFSEKLRRLAEQEFGGADSLYPSRRLSSDFDRLLERTVFGDFRLQIDKFRAQKRLVLSARQAPLPFMVWSAGQREFVPLLLSWYWLRPPGRDELREGIRTVVLEEPEAGLHPRAIAVVLLMVLELLSRGYRVCLSTHSPQVLETIWALRHLQACHAPPELLLNVFGVEPTASMLKLARLVLPKRTRAYYFDSPSGIVHDISKLDPGAESLGEAGWGGLAEFSSRANEAVARAVAESGRRP